MLVAARRGQCPGQRTRLRDNEGRASFGKRTAGEEMEDSAKRKMRRQGDYPPDDVRQRQAGSRSTAKRASAVLRQPHSNGRRRAQPLLKHALDRRVPGCRSSRPVAFHHQPQFPPIFALDFFILRGRRRHLEHLRRRRRLSAPERIISRTSSAWATA